MQFGLTVDFADCYSTTYQRAREKFLAAANGAGAALFAYENVAVRGPDGDRLFIDVACLGNARAKNRLIAISGTHGQEGFTGSALQIAWLRTKPNLDNALVVLLHSLNPWGFAHFTRGNENNVDINRNFVRHGGTYPENPGYAFLHEGILLTDWSTETLAAAERRFAEYEQVHGKSELFDCLARGQYTHEGGLNYGGLQRQWSNLVLERIVHEHMRGADRAAFIDWHTGIGEYAQPFFLCFSDPSSLSYQQAASWWGEHRIRDQRPHGLPRPNYRGVVAFGLQEFMPEAAWAGAVVEFGTRGLRMRRALRLDLWLRFRADRSTERFEMLHADMRDAFCPVEQAWRDSTIQHGLEIMQSAVLGLAAWSGMRRD